MNFEPISVVEIIIYVITIFIYFYLGLLIYLHDPKSWTNRLFLLLSVVLVSYAIVNPISLHPLKQTAESQLFWIRMVIFVASFIGPTLFLLAHTFPGRDITLNINYFFILFALTVITAAVSLSPLIFESISYPEGQPVPKPGKGIFLFVLNFPVLVFLSIIAVFKKYRRSANREKSQLLFFLFGIFSAFVLMVILTIILVTIFKTPAGISFGPMSPILLMGFIAYAIIKHRFLDIHLILARTVSFLFLIAVVAVFYTSILFVGSDILFGVQQTASSTIISIVLAATIALTFRPLYAVITSATNKVFFKGTYNSEALLARLSRIMGGSIDLDVLTHTSLIVLLEEMNISKGAFLIVNNHKIIDIKNVGYTDHQLANEYFEALLHDYFAQKDTTFVFDELKEGPVKELFRRLDVVCAIPIKVELQEIAVLVLGPKLSGEPFTVQDVNVLAVFASQSGIAIQNGKLFDELKKLTEELEKRVEERTKELKTTQEKELARVQEIARLKDEFVFIAAHELRTPITAIRGFLDLVEEAKERFPKDVKQHLANISAASNHLNQLIDDLLEISRAESGIMKMSVRPVNIVACVKGNIEGLAPLAAERRIKIKFSGGRRAVMALADREKLEEVISNLLSNAIKYNKEGGIIDINMASDGERIVVEFRDTGHGIPQKDQEKVFQKFFRASGTATQGVLGTGLGLFISRMLVEKMGGQVMFSSKEREGSTFAFSLPLPQ